MSEGVTSSIAPKLPSFILKQYCYVQVISPFRCMKLDSHGNTLESWCSTENYIFWLCFEYIPSPKFAIISKGLIGLEQIHLGVPNLLEIQKFCWHSKSCWKLNFYKDLENMWLSNSIMVINLSHGHDHILLFNREFMKYVPASLLLLFFLHIILDYDCHFKYNWIYYILICKIIGQVISQSLMLCHHLGQQ